MEGQKLTAAAPPARVPVASTRVRQFDLFYRDEYRKVAMALAYTLGDVDLAQEATDEAMARAFQRWATVSGYDNPGGWVYRVGLNWARSRIRRLARSLPFREPDTTMDPPIADPALRAALACLSVEQRSVVVCRLWLDWSVTTTADALDMSPGTVKSRLHRALKTLELSLAHLR